MAEQEKKGFDTENALLSQLDEEWLEVLKEVMESGVSKEDFRRFLEQERQRRGQK